MPAKRWSERTLSPISLDMEKNWSFDKLNWKAVFFGAVPFVIYLLMFWLLARWEYFPGAATAPFLLVLALYLAFKLLQSTPRVV